LNTIKMTLQPRPLPASASQPGAAAEPCLDAQTRALAEANVRDLLTLALEHGPQQPALIVGDRDSELNLVLAAAYRAALPQAQWIDFGAVEPAFVLAAFRQLAPGALVVLIQTTSFRLEAFRLRIELFKLGLKVIEHVHLARMPGPIQGRNYIEALAYDPAYFRGVGQALKARIDQASGGLLDSGAGALLRLGSPFEDAKLNVGDYRLMKNTGGQFPIGEVFTEARELEAVNGEVRIFVFGDTAFLVNKPERPITLVVEAGRVVATRDSTPEFDAILALIRACEGEVWLRELGFGLNRAFSRERLVDDIGTYERMCGLHLSLGAKHGSYAKPQFRRKDTRYHVDVFAITEALYLDDERVFEDGAWTVGL
jgi:aminopeptidase